MPQLLLTLDFVIIAVDLLGDGTLKIYLRGVHFVISHSGMIAVNAAYF
jgi:hypothetical protein